jgi:F-type H+-transporting ATPase subunit b
VPSLPAREREGSIQEHDEKLKFDASFFVVVVIFGIAYLLLKLVLFDPLLRILQRRERNVETAREVWQVASTHAEETLAEERRRMLAARRQAAARRDEARREAQEQRRAVLEDAKTQAQQELEAARGQLAADLDRESAELATRAQALAARIGERLVGRAV